MADGKGDPAVTLTLPLARRPAPWIGETARGDPLPGGWPRGTAAPAPGKAPEGGGAALADPAAVPTGAPAHDAHLGAALLAAGAVTRTSLVEAMARAAREGTVLSDVLLAEGRVEPDELMEARAIAWAATVIDPADAPPDPRLIDALGADYCLARGVMPWRRAGAVTVVATSRPESFAALRPEIEAALGPVAMALIVDGALQDAVVVARGSYLLQRSESRPDPRDSCRDLNPRRSGRVAAAALALIGAAALLAPVATFALMALVAILGLLVMTGLKLAAAIAGLRATTGAAPGTDAFGEIAWQGHGTALAAGQTRLPVISIIVPLSAEGKIVPQLLRRLGRLAYPRALLDIILAIEDDDLRTKAALSRVRLPPWMRVIHVPRGSLRTKPRALNYALDFCRGSVIGVYDAEDAPEPDQLHRVARRFNSAAADLACVQGTLDYYDAHTNWLSRCFTIEYAAWFRVVLPGMAALGLAVPLGGTTLFFRRAALEKLGGWDAHNVTEDADLGIRLARHGYRTALIDSMTEEEPNCGLISWIRQRSRWLKGYAITYAVHMRAPRRLWRDLGAWRFFGVQALFLGTLTQFTLAPVLWSFWLVFFGLPHPLNGVIPWGGFVLLAGLFLAAEALGMIVAFAAVWRKRHRRLRLWVPTLHFYFPLASLAAYKALWELVMTPFYWDKTTHGRLTGKTPGALPEALPRRPGDAHR